MALFTYDLKDAPQRSVIFGHEFINGVGNVVEVKDEKIITKLRGMRHAGIFEQQEFSEEEVLEEIQELQAKEESEKAEIAPKVKKEKPQKAPKVKKEEVSE